MNSSSTTVDPPLASARPPPKPLAYQSEIQQMMYVFGEVPEAIPQVTSLVEQIVQRHTIEMMSNAAAIAKRRGGKTISVDDVVFLVRYDRSRVNRLKDYLGWKDVRKKANTDDKDDMDPLEDDAPDTTMATKKRVKFMWEYVKEFTDHLEDEVNEDDEENLEAFRDMMIRLKADDEATRKMTRAEYMFYSDCKTASFTHRKGKRFRDWAMTDQLGGGKPADDVIDVVGFLCYEMVRQVTEMALQVRDQATERTRSVQEALERALNKGFHPPEKSIPEEVNAGALPNGTSSSSKGSGGSAKRATTTGDKDAADSATSLRVVPPHRSSAISPFDPHPYATNAPFVNGFARGLSTSSANSASISATHPPPEMHSPALSHSRLGSITEADHTSGAGEPMDVDPTAAQKPSDRADRASTPAAPPPPSASSVKAEPATTPQADGKPLKGKAKKKAEAAAAAAAKAAAQEKEKAASEEATKSSTSARGTKSTRGRKSKATLVREAKEAAAAAAAASAAGKDKGKDKDDRESSAAPVGADPPSDSPAHTPVMSNSASGRAAATGGATSGTPELVDALRLHSRPPSEPPTPFRRPATPAAPLPTTSALDHNAPSIASTPVRALLPLYSNHQWRGVSGGGGGDPYFGPRAGVGIGIETPLSHLSVPLVLTTNVPMYSLFTEQWRESLPQPSPVSPTDAGGTMDVDERATGRAGDLGGASGEGSVLAAQGTVDEGPVAPPPPRREPLQAAHIEEAYRRLMTAKCHTRMGRGSTRNAKPRRL